MMYSKCDSCGKEEPSYHNGVNWFKPFNWYERISNGGEILQCCSRECVWDLDIKRKEEGKDVASILPI